MRFATGVPTRYWEGTPGPKKIKYLENPIICLKLNHSDCMFVRTETERGHQRRITQILNQDFVFTAEQVLAMIFDNRTISEIKDQDLMDLIGNQEENLWIDFKEKHYEGYRTDGEKYKREICKDVTAMANAEGGYILIGVGEENKIAQRFVDIRETERKAESIYNTCHQHIVPRIAKLEIKPHKLRLPNKEYNLIIVHIPFSENRPHGFNSRGTLNFVKRYEDTTKEFQIEEFIPDLLARHQLPPMDDLREQLNRIENQTITILKEIGGNK